MPGPWDFMMQQGGQQMPSMPQGPSMGAMPGQGQQMGGLPGLFQPMYGALDQSVAGISDPIDALSQRAAMKQQMMHGANNQMGVTGQFMLPGQDFQQSLYNNGLLALLADWGLAGGGLGGMYGGQGDGVGGIGSSQGQSGFGDGTQGAETGSQAGGFGP